jgi:hypothetical protein
METKMDKIVEVETKLDELIEKHRALAARHEALFQTSKILIGLIDAPLPLLLGLMKSLERATLQHLNQAATDGEYQMMVEAALEELQAVAEAARV